MTAVEPRAPQPRRSSNFMVQRLFEFDSFAGDEMQQDAREEGNGDVVEEPPVGGGTSVTL